MVDTEAISQSAVTFAQGEFTMRWNWLAQIFAKSNGRGRKGRGCPKRLCRLLELESLEDRVLPIVSGIAVDPGGPFDGVVHIVHQVAGDGLYPGTGALLSDHSHILTAAHVVSGLGKATATDHV